MHATERARPATGLRQRVALARALLNDPSVLFLDEPTSGLDPVATREVHELIASLREQGVMWQDPPTSDPSKINVPTLIVHGAADAIVPLEYARTLSQLLPDAELIVLDGVGHVPTMTRPHEVVGAICGGFPPRIDLMTRDTVPEAPRRPPTDGC